MKERPILFSGPMVRAILDGRKTQTRRIIKPLPPNHAAEVFDWRAPDIAESAKAAEGCYYMDKDGLHFLCKCPYGTVGDRLWVRETWRQTCDNKSFGCVQYQADQAIRLMICDQNGEGDPIATRQHKDPSQRVGKAGPPWKPSIHMPRWASRITLEITGVRVERLNAITPEDAKAEGVECCEHFEKAKRGHPLNAHWVGFAWLWKSINGEQSWLANPWVWVIKFKKVNK